MNRLTCRKFLQLFFESVSLADGRMQDTNVTPKQKQTCLKAHRALTRRLTTTLPFSRTFYHRLGEDMLITAVFGETRLLRAGRTLWDGTLRNLQVRTSG
jgi:hypothetical protein